MSRSPLPFLLLRLLFIVLGFGFAQAAPLTISVTTTADTGEGSLRQALADAAAAPGADTITFAAALSGQTIAADVQELPGSGNLSAFVIDDTSGVTLDASALPAGLTLTKHILPGVACRLFYVRSGGSLTLRCLTLASAGGALPGSTDTTVAGGAILNSGTLTLDRCTLNANVGNAGGALYNGGTATLTNCTFTANIADTGAGIYSAGPLTLSHCTIAGNTAESVAGGLFANQPATLERSIIAGNTGTTGADLYNPAIITRSSPSLVENYSSTTNVEGVGLFISAPALLAPLGNYGGPTQTMPPLPGSPALDQASPSTPATIIDQRGSPRPLGPRADLGAVEGRAVVVTTTVDELDPLGSPGTGYSLREAIRDVEAGGSVSFDRGLFSGATPTTNTLTLTQGPLNAQRACTLDASQNPTGITILHVPTITAQPQSITVGTSTTAAFSIAVANLSGGLAWQWRKGGSPLATPSAITASLSIANAQDSDEGSYDVLLSQAPAAAITLASVTLAAFSTTSQPATLTVDNVPLTITTQPTGAMLAQGAAHTLSLVAIGPAISPLTYQWRRNGTAIKGATQSTYAIAKAQLGNAGAYTCLVKSGLNSLPSATAEIGVVQVLPITINLLEGGTFTTKVIATGNGLAYAWQKNSSPQGTTTPALLIKPVVITDAGLYTCTVTGLAGIFTGGAPTTLTVTSAAPQLVLPIAMPQATIGQAYYYKIPVAPTVGAPGVSFSASGLPSGLQLDTTTGIITGRPTATSPIGFPVTLKTSNKKGSSPPATYTLIVNAMPGTAIGTFTGPAARSPLNDNLGGRFDLTTTSSGFFSGSLVLGARKISFVKKLLLSSGPTDILLRGDLTNITTSDKTPLIAYIEVSASDQYTRLTLVHPNGTTLVIPAWRNPWVQHTNPALFNSAHAYATTYSLRLDAGKGGTISPSGYGFASFTVGTFGTFTLTGKLPDGNAITGSSFVGPNGEVLVHQLLYKNKGSFLGQLALIPATPVTTNTLDGDLTWLKPAGLPTTTDTLYKAGFGPLAVTAQGSAYIAPTPGQRLLSLPAAIAPATNAKLAFTLGGLDTEMNEFAQLLTITNPKPTGLTNTAKVPAYSATALPNPNPNKVTLAALDAKKGTFSGAFSIPFTPSGSTKILPRPGSYFGQIVRIGATTQGWGYFLLPSPPAGTEAIAKTPKLSGIVELKAP